MNTPAFSVYNASAGSGKTFALVKEYLKIILASPKQEAYKSILAITFTNKAVGEMKSRVVDNLSQFALAQPSPKAMDMLRIIAHELAMTPEAIQQKAKLVLKHLIHNYASFSITTIDKFTSSVIRTFAHDLNLPSTFEISTATENLLQEAIDGLLSQAGTNPALTKLLLDFALEKADDDKSWDVTRDIQTIGSLLSNENYRLEIEAFKEKSIAEFVTLKHDLIEKHKAHKAACSALSARGLELIHASQLNEKAFSKGYVYKFFAKNAAGDFEYKPNLSTYFQEGNRYAKTVPQYQKEAVDKLAPQLFELYTEFNTNANQLLLVVAFLKNINPLSLLNQLSLELQKIQEEKNILSISEFNTIIHEKIQNQPAPFIYERMGERYKHFFIDEFQDTSVMQWHNLIPLIDNALASEDLAGEQGTLMLVGDPKQAIYRWRGGKAEQFMGLFKDENPFSNPNKKTFPLDTNWRSYTEIIDFNNRFFNHIATHFGNEEYKELYEKYSGQKSNSKKGGFVSITFIPPSDVGETELQEENFTDSERYLDETVQTIKRVLAKGFTYKDIVVITRKKQPGVKIAAYLTAHSIPIVSSETLLIANSKEVQALIQILYYLANESHKEAKAKFLYYLGKYCQTKLLVHDFIDAGLQLQKEADFEAWLAEFGLELSFQALRKKALYEAVETLLQAVLMTNKTDAYVQDFLDRVLDFEIRNQSGVTDFLSFWESNNTKFSIPSPEGNNAVRLMTIHKSKGLEFPVVIFPFAEEDFAKSPKDKLWINVDEVTFGVPKALVDNSTSVEGFGQQAAALYAVKKQEELLDNINLLYVALTRAEEQLYIISKMNLLANGDVKQNNLSTFFIDYLLKIKQFNSSQWVYTFGDETKASAFKSSTASLQKIPQRLTVFNFSSIKIAQRESLMWATKQEAAIAFGNSIHEILANITHAQDCEMAIQQAIEQGTLRIDQKQVVEETVRQILTHPELALFFQTNNTVLNEQTIVLKKGPLLKPDRVVLFSNTEAGLLEYKTGAPQPNHVTQLETYSQALETMNFKVTKKVLVYIGEKMEIVPL